MNMTKPIIELKSVKVHVGLSDETPAYTAKVYVDGKHFANVSNSGHGGCDMVDAPSGHLLSNEIFKELESRIAATYPKHDMSKYGSTMDDMDESLECICHGLVWDSVDKRNFTSKLSRKIMFVEDEKLYTLSGKKSQQGLDWMKVNKPDAIILNNLTSDAAWELYKQC